ncbi:ABC-type glycerol-3-phosphate transport system, substrate-binding protein [Caloranaerobacter azorensis DSM 13643]|uniref:ABC-type glycerol-3-phosphate transport system, substrate-binding protein n=1 Tax=Caloranaerobacter azorensis DSM 13643 TaxID=1121264 RepID=A0A1M5S7B9_9FIRM|nr:ABC transporter substrate-binding protein [Caloranaerobacter azorensis]SHH34340.1 ABC-type glycerol-3-phosphate transport system, substrate-binding protein [Caloranaerobacter azorensis DSM 13643]
MKRVIAIILCLTLVLSLIGCTSTENSSSTKNKEITILMYGSPYEEFGAAFNTYKEKFERENGIKVKFDAIDTENKMRSKLYLKDGPTLIYIGPWEFYGNFVKTGIALKVDDKLKNYAKIYDSIKDENGYFVPIGMAHYPVLLNRRVFEKLGIEEPGLDWTREDYFRIREKWLDEEPQNFTPFLFKELIGNVMEELEIYDLENNRINIDKSKMIEYIKKLKDELHSGRYILNDNYTFENYYKMFFEIRSEEYKKVREMVSYNETNSIRRQFYAKNALNSLGNSLEMDVREHIILPQVIDKFNELVLWGFVVNKNGKNIDLGLEFLNGLLSDEVQLELFKKKRDYPVNKDIEDEIEKIEKDNNVNEKSIALRKYVLSKIKSGDYKSLNSYNDKYLIIDSELTRNIIKFVFADKDYTDEEMVKEIEKFENKLNMWLNE